MVRIRSGWMTRRVQITREGTLPSLRAAGLQGILVLALFLSGCMYPGKEDSGSAIIYRESVKKIQTAVDDYYKEEGLLPIMNADETTPRYEKFRIDLDKLNKRGYLDAIPATAFEKGGSAYFLLLDEERNPTVKVMDLVTVQAVNDVQRKVNLYRSSHGGELPAAGELYPGLYSVDGKKAGTESLKLTSVYSGQEMDFMIDRTGSVYADYVFDIMSAVDKGTEQPAPDEDLRSYLLENSWFVPVKSLPYYWVGGQPVPHPLSDK
ncbi:DUF3939 domain-containing protein [Paenibacillus rhizophilus]|nr:DUF3939 domain-containing protein [Paenibacillus rhizophilus]